MTLTFVSNYINHHQIPFSEACYAELGEDYRFIQTEPMEQERVDMGWGVDGSKIPYLYDTESQEELCRSFIIESDIVIFGWTEREDMRKERIQTGKPLFYLSERLYREGQWKAISPRGLLKKYKDHTLYRKAPVFLLCAGAYVASDFALIKAYPNKMFRFGYFPETIRYTEEEWKHMKESGGTVQIVWAGRFLPLKHPEFPVKLAAALKKEGREFHVHMVGGGEWEEKIRSMVIQEELNDYFTFYGFTEPSKVRRIMEKSHIHLFTSNYLEGWGAVVNEAMNSGCAVVANVQAGSVPYLIKHGENGLVYRDGSYEDFELQVKKLMDSPALIKKLGKQAYAYITEMWNAEHAADELLRFCRDLAEGKILPAAEGPLSPAPPIAPGDMYKKMMDHKI